jgi:hypothetical protein
MEPPMNRLSHPVAVVAVGAGLPITQLAIRYLRWPGAAAVLVLSAGVLAADIADLASGRSTGTVRRVIRIEAAAAGAATVAGAMLLLDPSVKQARDEGWRVGRPEMLRRLSLGLLFGVLSARVRMQAGAAGPAGDPTVAG